MTYKTPQQPSKNRQRKNDGKKKTTRMNVNIDKPVKIDGKMLEDIAEFIYQKSKVTREELLMTSKPGYRRPERLSLPYVSFGNSIYTT